MIHQTTKLCTLDLLPWVGWAISFFHLLIWSPERPGRWHHALRAAGGDPGQTGGGGAGVQHHRGWGGHRDLHLLHLPRLSLWPLSPAQARRPDHRGEGDVPIIIGCLCAKGAYVVLYIYVTRSCLLGEVPLCCLLINSYTCTCAYAGHGVGYRIWHTVGAD